jgi:hypothetical protein
LKRKKNASMYHFNKLCTILSLFAAFTLAFTLLTSLIFPLGCMVSPEIQNMRDAELPKMKPAEWENTDNKTNHYEMYELDAEKLLSTQNALCRIHEQGTETSCWELISNKHHH